MHQPYYKDIISGKYLMPWVRLHGVKDYYPMAKLVERFEDLKVTFNLVPVLAEQINDYAHNGATDGFLDLTMRRADDLSAEERVTVLSNFFRVNFKRFIEPHERYSELLVKRGLSDVSAQAVGKAAKNFSKQDYLDLQVLFNLAWFHSISLDEDGALRELAEKKKGYTEGDKLYVMSRQREILGRIIPLYRSLLKHRRIEITATPYYHPILPLLCDTSIAKVSSPGISLPRKRFSHPEDAAWHIAEAVRYHTGQFDQPPRGMWPSEGSVSHEVLDIMIANGIDWVAADEEVLFSSLKLYDARYRITKALDRRLIYQPYCFRKGSRRINVVFRDKNLSDMISFAYNSWDQRAAAEDLIGHFRDILENLRRDADKGLVTIVMDGENAWEYFEDNGRAFFETLYSRLESQSEPFGTTTISEYLAVEPAKKALNDIFPASWINKNFAVWIGDEQDNLAWEYLGKTRGDLMRFTREFHKKFKTPPDADIQKAWRELYIAEGSDWNWWYNGPARTGKDNPFDSLYRLHLKNVYKLLKKPVPEFLKISIA
jgi:alpha-amylase/alpha-mannosidase (GH57 family)